MKTHFHDESIQFLLAVLQLIGNSQYDFRTIQLFLEANQTKLDEKLLEVFPNVVNHLLITAREQELFFIITAVSRFGNLIRRVHLGMPWLNIELAIAAHQEILKILTYETFPEQWAMTQSNLGNALSERIKGDPRDNQEKAIQAYQQALRVFTYQAFPELWATVQDHLASALKQDFQGNCADNLEQAIASYRAALKVRTYERYPEEWAMTQHNLGTALSERIRGDRADNLEQAIASYRAALKVRTYERYPEEWAMTQHNLGTVLSERIRGDRADNLEQAIASFNLALSIFTKECFPRDWAMAQNSLGTGFSQRIQGKRSDNLEKAIIAYQLALEIYTQEHFPQNWAMTQHNLANALVEWVNGDDQENIKRAIDAYQQSLKIRTQEQFPQQWVNTQTSLAKALCRFFQGDRAENIEAAITCCQNALQVATFEAFPLDWAGCQNNLANAYRDRIRGNSATNICQAIQAYRNALLVYFPRTFPNECRGTACTLGNLYFDQQNFSEAADVYQVALEAAEILYQSCLLLSSKVSELTDTDDLPRRAAYTYAKICDLETAVLKLERNRARSLSETLERDRANLTQLQQVVPHLYEQYQDITNQLRNLESQQRDRSISSDRHSLTPETFRNTATQLRSELETTIAQIRQVEGYADFLDQPNFEDIRAALQTKRPLIYLVVTSAGSLALIITPDEIANLWLDDLTEASLQELLQTWFNAYNQCQRDRQSWLNVIDSVSHQLWQPLMEPLVSYLKSHNFDQAVLVPTGYLSLLPLHAAWTEDSSTPTGRHYALDDIHFTYAPNARSLTAAQAIATRAQANSILVIDNPTQDLLNSEREVQAAIAHFPQHQVLRHGEAEIASVREALQHCNILHLSCHGTANLQEPLTSGLLMSDGLLTLKDILDLNLTESATGGIRLAILSACETGLSGIENADEAISLPTGLLQAGVAGVIASLWAVSDLSTMLLITKFYDLWREQNLLPDQALRQAQIWLRDTTNEEKIAEFKAFIPAITNTRMSPATAQQLYDELAWEAKNERSFAHPFHWAAFNYTGI
ncbi:CHAT domain-containing protein [Leptolyngbya boryana CZ1]|uniref:CHAT domain-containing protein n=1 Tax=Leptolyngbya boryana CZ1 TaxID=3060204 RepID=A0AA97ALH1_LEPBY|nr:CHAT domain-containing protein [Leptolyngbya boryana]WNZ44018.1 CHAT domain-containing protein [Leptolyngbya boryana CZ1]